MPESIPALFLTTPRLRRHFPHHSFCTLPTPVQPFLLDAIPHGDLFIKRDDLSCRLYGGNKPRKLEFVIGAALARGARRLVTSGGLGTNHGLATTILGRAAGLATTLVLVPQPVTDSVRRSLLLDAAYGAELVYAGSLPAAVARGAVVLARSALRGERPFLVPTGGSSAAGELGFVSAGLELAAQVRAGEVPEPLEIWLPVGTGGSLSGLVAGLRLAGSRARVVGVLVTDILPPSPRRLARQATAALRRLRALGVGAESGAVRASDFAFVRDELGPGYGAATAAARDAVAAARECGVTLETTYTGKALAALRTRLRRAPVPAGPVLFWNTFNSVDPGAAAPRPLDPLQLPPALRAIVA